MGKLVFIGFILLLFSCTSGDEVSKSTEYSEYMLAKSIKTDIDFMPEEIYTRNDVQIPELKLELRSREIYGCLNFGLEVSQFKNEKTLIIRFESIIKSGICLTAMGPARTMVDLPLDVNKIIFINGNKLDEYDVSINEEKVSFSAVSKSFTTSLYDDIFRFPEHSFAFVCGTNTDNTYIYDEFLDILREDPAFEEFEFEGAGRIPYVEASDGHWVNHSSKYFKYTEVSEFEKLAAVLNNFSSQHIEKNSGVSIALTSWDNRRYYSWDEN